MGRGISFGRRIRRRISFSSGKIRKMDTWVDGLQMGGHDWEERFNLVCVQGLQLVGVEGFYLMDPIQ